MALRVGQIAKHKESHMICMPCKYIWIKESFRDATAILYHGLRKFCTHELLDTSVLEIKSFLSCTGKLFFGIYQARFELLDAKLMKKKEISIVFIYINVKP